LLLEALDDLTHTSRAISLQLAAVEFSKHLDGPLELGVLLFLAALDFGDSLLELLLLVKKVLTLFEEIRSDNFFDSATKSAEQLIKLGLRQGLT
jgi:hypothetical protein